jgi:WD40 repeat protein
MRNFATWLAALAALTLAQIQTQTPARASASDPRRQPAATDSIESLPFPIRPFGLGDLQQIAASPDLRFLASGGQAGVFLWDIETHALLENLEIPWSTTALAFSPDSQTLYAASVRSIHAWDTATRSPRRTFHGHNGEINRLVLSNDGTILASASSDNTVRLWSTESGEEQRSLRIPGSPILDVALSPDGHTLVTVDTYLTNCVKIWDPDSGALLRSLPTTNWPAQRILFSPQGQLLTVAADRILTLWNADTTQQIRSFTGVTDPSLILVDTWFPNDTTVASIANDGRVFLWNFHTTELLRVVEGEPNVAAAGVPGDHLVLAGNLDLNVLLRQLPDGHVLRTFQGHTTSTHSGVAVSPDGTCVLSAGVERSIRLWDRQTGQPVRRFAGSPSGTASAVFSPDGSRVFATVGLPNPGARMWNTETGDILRDFGWNNSWPSSLALSPDGTLLAAGAQDHRVRLFEVETGNLLRQFTLNGWPTRIAFSPRQPWLACGSSDNSVTLFHHHSGQSLHTFSANAGAVTALAFSSNGDTLLIAWQDGLAHLYHAESFELLRPFPVPAAFLDAAILSPDGSILVTGESFPAFTATLWDTRSGERLRTLPGHRWAVAALAFNSDGTHLLTGADRVREWEVTDLAARLRFTHSPDALQLQWSLGTLESSPQPSGPWSPVPNAQSPWTTPLTTPDPPSFFRVRATP